jgi:hypothetical protein
MFLPCSEGGHMRAWRRHEAGNGGGGACSIWCWRWKKEAGWAGWARKAELASGAAWPTRPKAGEKFLLE